MDSRASTAGGLTLSLLAHWRSERESRFRSCASSGAGVFAGCTRRSRITQSRRGRIPARTLFLRVEMSYMRVRCSSSRCALPTREGSRSPAASRASPRWHPRTLDAHDGASRLLSGQHLASNSKEPPLAGDPLQLVGAAVLELDARARHEILDRARHQHLAGPGL